MYFFTLYMNFIKAFFMLQIPYGAHVTLYLFTPIRQERGPGSLVTIAIGYGMGGPGI